MKRFLSLLMVSALIMSVSCACGTKSNKDKTRDSHTEDAQTIQTPDNQNPQEITKRVLKIEPLQVADDYLSTPSEGLFSAYKDSQWGIDVTLDDNGIVAVSFDHQKMSAIIPDSAVDNISDGAIVEGVSGRCVGIFVANIGQDYNPILCLLIEDGTVEILSLFNAYKEGDYLTSGSLNGFTDVVSFVSDGGGAYENEEGEIIYSYTTIYAIDQKGDRLEIFLFVDNGTLDYLVPTDNGTEIYRLYLSNDWKIKYSAGIQNSEWVEQYRGRYREEAHSDDYIIYQLSYQMLSEEAEKGTFELNTAQPGKWKVTAKTGLKFGGPLGEPIEFVYSPKL